MADSLSRGERGCHGIGPVTARLSQRDNTGIIEKIADSVVPSSGVFMDALRLNPSGKLDRSRLSSVCGAEYIRRARLWWIVLPKSGPVANAIAQSIRSFVSESAMDKLLADVETMFSAIADSIYKRHLAKLEY